MNHETHGQDIQNIDDCYQTRASLLMRLNESSQADRELAWAEFVARYRPIIASFATKCGASRNDVDDIVSEVMTSFFARSGEFVYQPTQGKFRSYLKTCTVRAALRKAGKNLKFQGIPLDQIPEPEQAMDELWSDSWESHLVGQGLLILREQKELTANFRAFEEYVLKDRAASVVAQELGISENCVHQAKSRMTKLLREVIARLRETEE